MGPIETSTPMQAPYDFETSIGYWVTMTAIAFRRALNEELAPIGLTHRQSQVLCWLKLEGTLSQTELACHMDIEPPTLAGIIDRMELAGWVKRASCPEDRRKKLIQLEPAAEPVWEQIAERARKVRSLATTGLSDAESTQLLAMLKLVNENLGMRQRNRTIKPECQNIS